MSGGSALTQKLAAKHTTPCLHTQTVPLACPRDGKEAFVAQFKDVILSKDGPLDISGPAPGAGHVLQAGSPGILPVPQVAAFFAFGRGHGPSLITSPPLLEGPPFFPGKCCESLSQAPCLSSGRLKIRPVGGEASPGLKIGPGMKPRAIGSVIPDTPGFRSAWAVC
ncbi:MAG: hypothetical protein ACOWYE_06790 [Desulfatiglandales bacterium]